MDGNEPLDMYASGAAKRKPCAVATIGSFKGDLCISISFFGTEEDRKIVENFYKEFENALIEIERSFFFDKYDSDSILYANKLLCYRGLNDFEKGI